MLKWKLKISVIIYLRLKIAKKWQNVYINGLKALVLLLNNNYTSAPLRSIVM
ncbi:hypothetical protein MuYL_3048 [Mucilaginibacter xinganensis]|uniref:Uncharacterized protein n=1 Tax=Mucilaginibacter xinganensis TaxID=1234841 RepID=A0A223NYJ7_9SPHI|nr:hypothetical protein MuYL_3048 [Mucilaginibacter xinganensis]